MIMIYFNGHSGTTSRIVLYSGHSGDFDDLPSSLEII